MILILGNKGNMGRRYAAILRYLGVEFKGLDLGWEASEFDKLAKASSGFIIATPTTSHVEWVSRCIPYSKPILCEKPISTNMDEIAFCLEALASSKAPFNMVNQYSYLAGKDGYGVTLYDYWNHGKDGLAWDCIQLAGLATGELILKEESPIWRCIINSDIIDLKKMDGAYIDMVTAWIKKPGMDLFGLADVHNKTNEIAKILGNYGSFH